MFYTEEDFKAGCSFNYWYGAGTATVGCVVLLLAGMWVLNII